MSTTKGEHGTCPTVKIKTTPCDGNAEGIVEINQADFNPDVHELHGAEKKAEAGKGEKGNGKKNQTKDEAEAGKGEK